MSLILAGLAGALSNIPSMIGVGGAGFIVSNLINGYYGRGVQIREGVLNRETQQEITRLQAEHQRLMQERQFAEAEQLQKKMSEIQYSNALQLQKAQFDSQIALSNYIYFRDNVFPLIDAPEHLVEDLKKLYSPDRTPLQIIVTDSMPPAFGGVRKEVRKFFQKYYLPISDTPVHFYDQGWKDSMRGKNGSAQIGPLFRVFAGMPTLLLMTDTTSDGEDMEMNVQVALWGLGEMQHKTEQYLYEKNLKELEHEIPDKKQRQLALAAMLQISAAAISDFYHLIQYGKEPQLPKICNEWSSLSNTETKALVADLFVKLFLAPDTSNKSTDLISFTAPLNLALTAKAFQVAGDSDTAERFAKEACRNLVLLYENHNGIMADEHRRAKYLLPQQLQNLINLIEPNVEKTEECDNTKSAPSQTLKQRTLQQIVDQINRTIESKKKRERLPVIEHKEQPDTGSSKVKTAITTETNSPSPPTHPTGYNINSPESIKSFIDNIDAGQTASVQLFIENGINVNAPSKSKRTPLHIAVCVNHEIVNLLLHAGANVNAQDINGRTPLHYLAGIEVQPLDFNKIIKTLLERARVNIQDNQGNTPLHLLVKLNWNVHICRTLIAAGADVDKMDHEGNSPLHTMIINYYETEPIKALIGLGANCKLRQSNSSAKTPSELASERMFGSETILKLLKR